MLAQASLAFVTMLGLPASARAPLALPHGELTAQVEDSFCAGEDSDDGQVERWVLFGSRGCPNVRRETRRQRAIVAALDDANSVLVSFDSEALTQARALEDRRQRRHAFFDALLADPANARAFWGALEAQGYVRSDRAPLAPPARRELAWKAFEPYVIAHAWPDPVVTPRHPDGTPSGPAKFSLHVCAGLNGIHALERPDPLLARVAFVAAFDAGLGDRMTAPLRAIAADLRQGPPRSDDELTALARARLAEAVRNSSSVRRAMCRAVARREAVFGVHLTG